MDLELLPQFRHWLAATPSGALGLFGESRSVLRTFDNISAPWKSYSLAIKEVLTSKYASESSYREIVVCSDRSGHYLERRRLCAADWPMWGGDPSRNMVSAEKNLPTTADPGKAKAEGQPIDPATTKNVKWAAPLGSASYGNVTVAGGRVFIGCNNASPRDPKYQGDYSILLCLDEQTGKMLWQLACPKLSAGKVNDWEQVGLCSSPTVDGDHVYVVTNRCEVALP